MSKEKITAEEINREIKRRTSPEPKLVVDKTGGIIDFNIEMQTLQPVKRPKLSKHQQKQADQYVVRGQKNSSIPGALDEQHVLMEVSLKGEMKFVTEDVMPHTYKNCACTPQYGHRDYRTIPGLKQTFPIRTIVVHRSLRSTTAIANAITVQGQKVDMVAVDPGSEQGTMGVKGTGEKNK